MINFTWWVNRKDSEGMNVFEGGFLGLDNIGVFDRSRPLPTGGRLSQSDGTSWMAMYCLNMLAIALELAEEDDTYEDVASKFWDGRNYNSKQVGHYVRLLEFEPNETIIERGTWETSIFFVLVEGKLEAYIADEAKGEKKVGEVAPGKSFGEMAVLAGVQRSATVKVAAADAKPARVLEFTRPALRLLRKFPEFGKVLDRSYRNYGLDLLLNEIKEFDPQNFDGDLIRRLGDAARFVVYEKDHVLFRTGDPINRLVFMRTGWIQRVKGADFNPNVADLLMTAGSNVNLDFLGAGNCLGTEAFDGKKQWNYSATVMGRAEVMEIAVARLETQPDLTKALVSTLNPFTRNFSLRRICRIRTRVRR